MFLFSKSDFLVKGDGFEDHLMDDELHTIHHIGFDFDGEFYQISDFILLKTATDVCIPWCASQADTLSEGWEVMDN